VDVLVRALDTVAETDADIPAPNAAVRMRLFRTVRRRGKALQVQMAVQQQIAGNCTRPSRPNWTG